MGVGAAMHLYGLLCLIYDANKIHIIGTECFSCCSLLAYSLSHFEEDIPCQVT